MKINELRPATTSTFRAAVERFWPKQRQMLIANNTVANIEYIVLFNVST